MEYIIGKKIIFQKIIFGQKFGQKLKKKKHTLLYIMYAYFSITILNHACKRQIFAYSAAH